MVHGESWSWDQWFRSCLMFSIINSTDFQSGYFFEELLQSLQKESAVLICFFVTVFEAELYDYFQIGSNIYFE